MDGLIEEQKENIEIEVVNSDKQLANDSKAWIPYSVGASSAAYCIQIIVGYFFNLPTEVSAAIGMLSTIIVNGVLVLGVILLKKL